MHSKTLKTNQAKRNEWAAAILIAVIVYIVANLLLFYAHIEFVSAEVQQMRLWFGFSIPSLLLLSIVLNVGKGCLQRFCEILLVISTILVPMLAFGFNALFPSRVHNFRNGRQVTEAYVENGACGSCAHEIVARKGWGPFFYRRKCVAIDTYPTIGKEINGKVKVSYEAHGMTITRDLDEWLNSKGE